MDIKILVIDDEEQLQNLLLSFLTDLKYNVETANRFNQAMELLSKNHYDIVLTDKNFEGLDGNIEGGMDILRYISEHLKSTQVIIMTGYATLETAIEAMRLGAFDYIMKPFKLEDIKRKIERVCQYKRLLNSENKMFEYKTLHNEILDLIQKETDLSDKELKTFLQQLDKRIDQFFHTRKKWNFSWFNIRKNDKTESTTES